MSEYFEFADLVEAFESDEPLRIVFPGDKGEISPAGRRINKPPVERQIHAVLAPIGTRDLNNPLNGNYTTEDRKVFCREPLGYGVKIIQGNVTYEIDRESPRTQWTDVFIYYARGTGK